MLTLLKDDIRDDRADRRSLLQEIIRERRIVSHFQPIVDLHTGEIYAREVLSRADEPFRDPAGMFAAAHAWGLSWELENACRMQALETIAAFPRRYRDRRYFFNVSPHIFSDPRFVSGTTVAALESLGLDTGNVVFEITETATVEDYDKFEELIRYYVAQGFQVALDDFGAGHSGLVTLVAMTPHFLKIDMALVQGIGRSAYKQNLVRAISTFAREVGSSCIAEGIETFDDLETLVRLGIRYGQGFLLGRPSAEVGELEGEVRGVIAELIEYRTRSRFSVDLSIAGMVTRPQTYALESVTCEELDAIFRKSNDMDHIILMDREIPVGLLTRRHFYSVIGGRYGYSLFQKKFAETIAKTDMLSLEEHMDLRSLGRLAMDRSREDLYDPVIITDSRGRFIGTITMKQVINSAFDMEIKIATCANPLTQLPGNMIIGFWLEEAVRGREFTVVYADLDNFKAYNDVYGFSRGDEALRLTATVLSEFIAAELPAARLGHIGGDDFIIVSDQSVPADTLNRLCRRFDREREGLFECADRERGWYEARDRRGRAVRFPLVSLSLAVVTGENFRGVVHPGQLGQVAALIKSQVKARNLESGGSGYLIDRRLYG